MGNNNNNIDGSRPNWSADGATPAAIEATEQHDPNRRVDWVAAMGRRPDTIRDRRIVKSPTGSYATHGPAIEATYDHGCWGCIRNVRLGLQVRGYDPGCPACMAGLRPNVRGAAWE